MEKPNVNDDVKTVMIGTGDGGLRPGTQVEAVTPGMQPNIAVLVIGPVLAIVVRNVHLFLITLVSLMTTGGMTGNAILPWTDFTDLVTKCTMAAGVTAAFGVIKDFATLFGRLEQRFPFLTGNV